MYVNGSVKIETDYGVSVLVTFNDTSQDIAGTVIESLYFKTMKSVPDQFNLPSIDKLPAIKALRDATGLSLIGCKRIFEAFQPYLKPKE